MVNTKELSRDEWLFFRTKGIGGSDVGAILGISPYKQPLRVYMEKTGQWDSEDLSDNEAVEWGNILEPIIAKKFSEKNKQYKIQNCNYILQNPDYPFMLANIDRALFHPEKGWGILEIKTANARMESKWETDHIPDEYSLQIQHYLAVSGLDWGYVAVLIGGQKFKQYYVERDQELINILIEKESDFWMNHVEALEPPMANVMMDCRDIFDKLYPVETIANLELEFDDEHILSCIDKIEEANSMIDHYKNVKEIHENIIKDKMANHEKAKFHGGSISWKYSKPSFSVDGTWLKENHPTIHELSLKERKRSRVFRISKK